MFPSFRPPSGRGHAGALVVSIIAAGLATGISLVGLLAATAPPPQGLDPCRVPAGVVVADAERAFALRWALACVDLSEGRISPAEYRERIDGPAPPPAVVWGHVVRSVSSQWSATQWSAERALGAPDVFPEHADRPLAWASLEADAPAEHLEVGLPRPMRVRAVEVLETLNPGAVTRIDLVGADGQRRTVHEAAARPLGAQAHRRVVDLACSEPVTAVRVTLDSAAVPGWNEIDAIGVTPCD
jgi:hypothetical protein